jgi:transcriptional regulator with GAF, ATPase, and Fis domain
LVNEDLSENNLILLHTLDGKLQGKNAEEKISAEDGIIGHVLKNKKGIFVNNLAKDKRFSSFLTLQEIGTDEYKTKSCMIMPLLFENTIVGVLTISDSLSKNGFSIEEFSLVRLVAMKMTLTIKANGNLLAKVGNT